MWTYTFKSIPSAVSLSSLPYTKGIINECQESETEYMRVSMISCYDK